MAKNPMKMYDGQVLSLGNPGGAITMDAESIGTGMSFLVGELEKRDMELTSL